MALTSNDEIPTQLLDGAVKEYSRDKVYVLTALVLGLITVVEVMTYSHPDFLLWKGDNLKIGVLLLLMAVKFFIVAYIFMHLKFDKPILTWAFYTGLALAVLVYLAVMVTFRMFSPESMTAVPAVISLF
jgi:cytochrome c oxidase subunit IV